VRSVNALHRAAPALLRGLSRLRWKTNVLCGLNQCSLIGLRIVEAHHDFFLFEVDGNLRNARNSLQSLFTVIGQAAQVIPGTLKLVVCVAGQRGVVKRAAAIAAVTIRFIEEFLSVEDQ
jgi:hypothetical protein